MAKPRGYVRTFVDLGKEMSALLTQFPADHRFADYAKTLHTAFPVKSAASPPSQRDEANSILLTDREFEIILLLHQRLSNQEIADRLFVSYSTVKRHTSNIYKKLQVRNRREAVNKALSLRIITV